MDNYTEINVTHTNRVDKDRLHKAGIAPINLTLRHVYLTIVVV
jgi:hypothetical protein